jgi:hypothetical protein
LLRDFFVRILLYSFIDLTDLQDLSDLKSDQKFSPKLTQVGFAQYRA